MANVSEFITLSVGTPATIPYYINVGLGIGAAPPEVVGSHGIIGRFFSPVNIEVRRGLHEIKPVNQEVRL